ncbi:MAG: hypothetical protein HYZ37_16600 [Candidatus Solibacter usitatus]|nr:hypothetical protein [Candidatus Solibacter usitatus]
MSPKVPKERLTRRRWAAIAATPALAAPSALAQATPDEDTAAQQANLKRWRDQLAQVKLPRDTEPAFSFKA